MSKDITLVILAGGMGSRFGGLKQVEPMGPNGEFIIDYSIFDAIKAGFTKIVFIIKEENYELFKETVGKRVSSHIKVDYVFQNNDYIPDGFSIPKSRVKPLGTAHAILCCKEYVNEPFAIINADDFYGRDAYFRASEFLLKHSKNYGLVGYLAKNTIPDHGVVKRGVCSVKDNYLEKIVESKLERVGDKIIATPLNSTEEVELSDGEVVSMNMILFDPSIFEYLDKKFPIFLEKNKDKLDTCEFLIPEVLFEAIKENYAKVEVFMTNAVWQGVTYKEDTPIVRKAISDLIDQNEYKNNLWD